MSLCGVFAVSITNFFKLSSKLILILNLPSLILAKNFICNDRNRYLCPEIASQTKYLSFRGRKRCVVEWCTLFWSVPPKSDAHNIIYWHYLTRKCVCVGRQAFVSRYLCAAIDDETQYSSFRGRERCVVEWCTLFWSVPPKSDAHNIIYWQYLTPKCVCVGRQTFVSRYLCAATTDETQYSSFRGRERCVIEWCTLFWSVPPKSDAYSIIYWYYLTPKCVCVGRQACIRAVF